MPGREPIARKHAYETAVDPFSGDVVRGVGHAPLIYVNDPRADLPADLQARVCEVIDGRDGAVATCVLPWGAVVHVTARAAQHAPGLHVTSPGRQLVGLLAVAACLGRRCSCGLAYLDEVTVRVADVGTDFVPVVLGPGEERGAPG